MNLQQAFCVILLQLIQGVRMASKKHELGYDFLSSGSEYCLRFRENIAWLLWLSSLSVVLSLVLCYLVFSPQVRTFYVSSTEGAVVEVSPIARQGLQFSMRGKRVESYLSWGLGFKHV